MWHGLHNCHPGRLQTLRVKWELMPLSADFEIWGQMDHNCSLWQTPVHFFSPTVREKSPFTVWGLQQRRGMGHLLWFSNLTFYSFNELPFKSSLTGSTVFAVGSCTWEEIQEKETIVAGEMAQWLEVHTVLAEDPNLIPKTHIGWLTTVYNTSSMKT